eukprot:3762649-Rhodomonas_salina.1
MKPDLWKYRLRVQRARGPGLRVPLARGEPTDPPLHPPTQHRTASEARGEGASETEGEGERWGGRG